MRVLENRKILLKSKFKKYIKKNRFFQFPFKLTKKKSKIELLKKLIIGFLKFLVDLKYNLI